jgi:choline dehydrogenase-like flavoprotein
MQRLPYISTALVLSRDTSSGSVTVNAQGRPIISYSLNATDKSHLQTGVRLAMAVLQGAGASEVFPPYWQAPGLLGAGLSVEEFQAKVIERLGEARNIPELKLFSAHQMSSCRLANTATRGVVDPNGRVFGTKNVFVADGSVLPTATGVNPMLTITTVSHFLSQRIKAIT